MLSEPSTHRTTRRLLTVATLFAASLVLPAAAWANNIERNPFNGNKIHWSDASGTKAWVTIVDHTGPNWPVYAAAIEWDFAGRIDVTYRSGDCGGNGHCVGVNNYDFGKTCREKGGKAILVYPLTGSAHLTGDTEVDLNQRCADNTGEQFTNGDRRVITCQEEGHVLGVDHDYDAGISNTCMAATGDNFDRAVNTPRHHDFLMLDDYIYDHND